MTWNPSQHGRIFVVDRALKLLPAEKCVIFCRDYPAQRILLIGIEYKIVCSDLMIYPPGYKIYPVFTRQSFNNFGSYNECKIRIDIFLFSKRSLLDLIEHLLTVITVNIEPVRDFNRESFRWHIADCTLFIDRIIFQSILPWYNWRSKSCLVGKKILHNKIWLVRVPEIWKICTELFFSGKFALGIKDHQSRQRGRHFCNWCQVKEISLFHFNPFIESMITICLVEDDYTFSCNHDLTSGICSCTETGCCYRIYTLIQYIRFYTCIFRKTILQP